MSTTTAGKRSVAVGAHEVVADGRELRVVTSERGRPARPRPASSIRGLAPETGCRAGQQDGPPGQGVGGWRRPAEHAAANVIADAREAADHGDLQEFVDEVCEQLCPTLCPMFVDNDMSVV